MATLEKLTRGVAISLQRAHLMVNYDLDKLLALAKESA